MKVRNQTPFEAGIVLLMDRRGEEQLHVVLKATFSISPSGQLAVAEEQQPIAAADEFHGDPTSSSIKQEAELAPLKSSADLFLVGSAWAPARGARAVDVSFRVGSSQK